MANQQIFCNTPWYEAHIYWDGSLGICCQESRKLYTGDRYNIRDMSLTEWFNSEPVREFRKSLLSDTPTDICSRCYLEQQLSNTSRRHKSNLKSVIFTNTAFADSFEQSPGRRHFTLDGITDTLPIDLHIDLGNYCNLACKMCGSDASTTIATQYVQWGHEDHRQYLGVDWTKDSVVWERFLNELLTIPKLKNIHFMGGETLLTKRFEDLVDFMILHKRFDLSFSFVTNGTVFNLSLLEKLKQFARVGMEVSIETTTDHNAYIRQGSTTEKTLSIIQQYKEHTNGSSVSLTLRPTISLLSIGYYHTLLEYCLEHRLLIKSLMAVSPTYLNADILPTDVRQAYLQKYLALEDRLATVNVEVFNESAVDNYEESVKIQVQQVIKLLNRSPSPDSESLLGAMVEHCKKWDQVYKFNARSLYPELDGVFLKYGY